MSLLQYTVCAFRPVPDPLDVNQKVPRLRGAAKARETEQFLKYEIIYYNCGMKN